MTERRAIPGDPFPPSLTGAAGPLPAVELDAVDAFVLGNLDGGRLFHVADKRIVRGRLVGPTQRRRAFTDALRRLPVDAFLQRDGADTVVTVSRPKTPAVPRDWPRNALLFLATLLTTTWGGAYWNGIDPFAGFSLADPQWGRVLAGFAAGLPFALSLLAILTCHELGHYVAARRYGLDTTLPFYIPIPPMLSPVGTLGAVIKMRTPLYDRRILLDVGAAGPLAGVAAALPILAWGIRGAPAVAAADGPGLYLNEPLLFRALELLLRPDLPTGGDIQATSLVLAGWLGLFVTALNLLPVGQLDGGHAAYALFGARAHKWLGRSAFITILALAPLGWVWHGTLSGLVYALLLFIMLRVRHPQAVDETDRLSRARVALALLTLIVFLLSFTPFPITII